jgi:hypothetical protein
MAILTLYFIPSPRGFDWSTPTKLARAVVKNKISSERRFMGHVNIELEYTNENGEKVHILTGMVAEKLNAVPLLLKEKIGLGVIFHSFPGKLENKNDLEPELKMRAQKGNKALNFVKFKINLETAKRIEKYFADYAEANIGRYYGLVNSPLHGEGSGCSAFGASFLKVAGILDEEYKKHWTHCIRVPHHLAGAPIHQNKVSFLGLVLGNHRWAREEEDHHELFFWDPDRMHAWVEQKISEFHHELSTYQLTTKENSTGIIFDVTHKEAPQEPIFKGESQNGKPVSQKPNLKERSNLYKHD